MCGRFLLTAPPEAVQRLFGFLELPNLEPRYNNAPSQPVAAMVSDAAAERHFLWMRWGLVPSWAHARAGGGRSPAPLQLGRAHGWTPATTAHHQCRLLLQKTKPTSHHP